MWYMKVLEHHREKLKSGRMEGDQAWHGECQTVKNNQRALQVLLFFICILSLQFILYKK